VVQVVTIEAGLLKRTLPAVGSLRSAEMTTIASEVSGTVEDFDIPDGQLVESRQLLARVDDAEATAAVAVARARHTNAQQHLLRFKTLRTKSVSSEQAYEDALALFEAAQGLLIQAETRLAKTVIRAPFSGVLGLRQINLGQYLEPGDPIVEITRIDPLELDFHLPQRHAGELAVGQVVLGMVGLCGARFEARVEAIDPRVDPNTRTVLLRARVPNPQRTLRPGMSARVRILVGEVSDALLVPQEAIVRQGTKHIVFSLDAVGVVQQHEVSLGQFFVDGVHVVSGLAPGQTVVVAGQQRLRPGSPAEPEPYTPISNRNLDLGRFGPSSKCTFEVTR
jgi:membrane fusion protein (multidrug efflux system)